MFRWTPALEVIPEPTPGQLLQEQAGDHATTIEAYVHDQCVAIILHEEGAMELREPNIRHIWYMKVTYATTRRLMDRAPIALHPVSVAPGVAVGRRADGEAAWLAAISRLEQYLHLAARLIDEQLIGQDISRDRPPVDRQNSVACLCVDAWCS